MSQPTSADQSQEVAPIISGDEFRILLDPPTPLINEDGSFNHEKFLSHISWITRKYRQIYADVEPSLEPEALDGAEIKDPTDLNLASVPLTYLKMWTVPISVGSNNQKFTVEIDTGSRDLWVPSSDGPHTGRKEYNPSTSKTSKKLTGTFKTQYADGLTVSGPIYSDTVTMGSVKATGQHFAAATSISESYERFPRDGIIGLGFQEGSRLNAPPFIQNAAALKQIPSPAFALKLTKTKPSINLGGPDVRDCKGKIEYHDVAHTAEWRLSGTNVTVNRKVTASNFNAVIDSGAGAMVGPPDAVKAFYAAISGSRVYDEKNGLYAFPTRNAPSVSFNWGTGQKEWVVSAENFSLGTIPGGQTIGALISKDLLPGQNLWLLGDKFLQNVYSVFDFTGAARIGFAEPA